MNKEILKHSVDTLNISNDTINKLKENSVGNIGQLCKKSKTDLKNLKIFQSDIKKLEIKIQIIGLEQEEIL